MTHTEKVKRTEVESDLSAEGVVEISASLRQLLADVFTLYIKSKSFHWHITGRHFRDYHLRIDEHVDQIFAMTDKIAKRGRKIGGSTIRSIVDISQRQRLKDNDVEHLPPGSMLAELRADNQELTRHLRAAHSIGETHNDVATTSLSRDK